MADDDQILPSHFSSFDSSPLPSSFSSFDEDTMRTPEAASAGVGLSGAPDVPVPWSDMGHHAAAALHGLGATYAGFAAGMSGDPETEAGWRKTVAQQQLEEEESRAASSTTAQGGWRHPGLWAAEQLPGIAALAVPAAVATGVAGPAGGAAVLGLEMGAQTEGDVYNRLTQEGIEPTFRQKAGAFALGAAQGLAMEVTGGAGKIATSPIISKALGIGAEGVVFGAGAGAEEYTSQADEIAAGKRVQYDPGAIISQATGGLETGVGFGASHLFHGGEKPLQKKPEDQASDDSALQGTGRNLTQTPGQATVARTPPDKRAAEAKEKAPPPSVADPNAKGPAAPDSPAPPGSAEEQAMTGKPVSTPANPTPTPGVEQQVETVNNQPGVAQPSPLPSQTAAGAPSAPDTTRAVPTPQPPSEARPAPAPAPSATATIPEPTASLQEQQAALLDPANQREAMIYPPGVKPLDITQNKWRYGTLKLPDGRYVQYDTRGPRALSKAKILEMYNAGKTNDLLQLGPVSQEEAVQRSVAGENPAVVTERAPPTTPGEPGVERKAAEGTTATAPDQVAAMEAVKTPGSTVQVETHEQAAADRFKKTQDEEAAPPETKPSAWAQRDFEIKAADGSTAGIITAHYDSTTRKINVTNVKGDITPGARVDAIRQLREAFPDAETIGGVRSSGVQAANEIGMGKESTLALSKEAPTPRVEEPTKLGETKFLSVWRRPDGSHFKRYADGREEAITESVANLLTKQEAYKPAEKSEAEKIREAAQASAPPPVRRVLRSETAEEQEAAARQAEADRISAERVQAETTAEPKVKPPKEKEEIQPKRLGEEKQQKLIDLNAVADDVARNHPPKDDETWAAAQDGKEVPGARKRLQERAAAMVKEATDRGYKFMRPLKERTGPTNHTNGAVLLHEAQLLARKKVLKAADVRRFMYAENELRNNGEAGRQNVMEMRKQTGGEWARAGGGPTPETAKEGVEGGEAAGPATREGVSHGAVEKPDVAEVMHETKERLEEEKTAQEPGEERKLTENERQAQETSERALAKLAEREKAAPSGAEGKVRPAEGEGRAEAPTPRVAAGFKVEKVRPKWQKEEAPLTSDERKELHAAGWTDDEIGGYSPEEARAKLGEERRPYIEIGGVDVRPSRTIDAETAIKENYDAKHFTRGAPFMMNKLRDIVVKIAGGTPVHYVTGEEMERITGGRILGAFSLTGGPDGKPVIIINADRVTRDTPLHEAFHAATELAIRQNPKLGDLMERLRVEVLKDLPDLNKEQRLNIAYYLTNHREFLTGMMTNPHMQEYLKGVKISAELARDLDIPKWRKMTMWEGALSIIRQALGLHARDTSAIEAAMSLSEQLMWRDPRGVADLMSAAGRLARFQMEDKGWLRQEAPPERDQAAVIRSPRETFDRVKDIDKAMVKQFTKDKLVNLSGAIMKGSAKVLSGTWLDDVHGHLFRDAKGSILQAINDARNKVSHQYNQLMRKDMDIVNRGYMLDRTHASQMADYAKLIDMSLRYNIHADRDAPATPKNAVDASRKNWQRDKFGDEARAIYDRLHPDLQKRYTMDKKFAVDKQGDMAKVILDTALPMFDTPKGSTRAELMERAGKNEMTDDDWSHYEKLGIANTLHEAYRLAGKKDVFFNSQRDGRYVVNGRYEMPKGGKDVAYSGEELPDNVREFDTEQQAHAYVAGTRMKAVTREVNYHKDNATGEIKRVSGEEAASVGTVASRYRVSLERQNYQAADNRAEAERNRQAMEADGVKELSGVMDKRDEKAWSQLNSADQKLLERKIDSRKDLTDAERQHMKDVTRQMMLSSRGGMGTHMIEARKVAGARFDTAAGLHAYARAANFHIARQAHVPELNEAMDRLDVHEKANRSDVDSYRRSVVANEMRNRVYGAGADALSSSASPLFHKMMTWAFINFLARPSHIILSQLHPYIYSVPMMAARHGYWKSLQAQRQAMRDLGGMGHNLLEGAKAGYEVYKSGGEQNIDKAVAMARGVDPILRMINGLKDKGERDALMNMWQTEHLHSAFDASVFSGSGMDRTNAIVRQFTDAMEANNRLSTALAAYRLEKTMHKDPANALAYSRRVIEQTHGVFSPTNAATVFKNPIMRGVMQFRQQPMNLAIMMYRNMAKALPEKLGGHGDNEARWTLAYQLGTAAALGGMGGMPMDLPKLVGLAGQAAGGPSPAEWDDKFYRTLVDNLGETAAKLIHDGLPGIMGPYGPSLGHRTGFDAGFLFGEPKSDNPDDLYGYIAKSLAGASVGMGADWLNAVHQAAQGDFERAGESILPGSLKDMLKTYRNATQGVTAGKEEIAPGSFGDELLQMLGFSGIERERQMAGHFALQKAIKADQAQKAQTVGEKLKAKRQAGKTVLGVKVGKKEMGTAREYENAYQ